MHAHTQNIVKDCQLPMQVLQKLLLLLQVIMHISLPCTIDREIDTHTQAGREVILHRSLKLVHRLVPGSSFAAGCPWQAKVEDSLGGTFMLHDHTCNYLQSGCDDQRKREKMCGSDKKDAAVFASKRIRGSILCFNTVICRTRHTH